MRERIYSILRITIGLCLVVSASAIASADKTTAELPASWDFESGIDGFTVINNQSGSDTFEHNRWSNSVNYYGSFGDSADDILVLPPVYLHADKVYEVCYSSYANWFRIDWDPQLEWVIGKAPVTESLNSSISEVIHFDSTSGYASRTFTFSVNESGEYYIGAWLKANEAQGSVNFYINSISIDSGYDGNSPQAPNLTITPAISGGKLINNIRLEAPAHTLSGLPLSDVLKYEISNTSGRFSVQGEITPLQSIDLADMECDEKGETYTAFIISNGIEGKPAINRCIPKYDTPLPPSDVKISQNGNDIQISWNPVTAGAEGGLFNPSSVVYSVQRNDQQIIATKTRSTSATDTPAIPEHGQSLISYTVTAYANAESHVGESANSNSCIVGNPYSRMFEESFAEAATSTSVWTSGPDPESRSAWSPTRASYSSPECRTAYDNDGGFLCFAPSKYYPGNEYHTPVIDMRGCKNATLEFYCYKYPDAPDTQLVRVAIIQGDNLQQLTDNGITFKGCDEWERVCLEIPEKIVENGPFRIVFIGSDVNGAKAIIDKISVRNILESNLTVSKADAVKTALPGDELPVTVSIRNEGKTSISDAEVSLTSDYISCPITDMIEVIAPGETTTMRMKLPISPFMSGKSISITAEVFCDEDMDSTDNTFEFHISVGSHDLCAITDLNAIHSDNGVILSWTLPAPDSESSSIEMTESFEDWTTGDTTPRKDWIFIDADGRDKFGLAGINEDKKFAFFVTDKFSSYYSFDMAEGEKALVTTKNADYSTTDSWLISPVIDPSHAVSFKAAGIASRSYTSVSFELGWLPESSTDPRDFVKLTDIHTDGYDWEEISRTFPPEASRFAIHVYDLQENACAFDQFNFHTVPEIPVLRELRVYRNGEKTASLQPDNISWVDSDADPSIDNHYHVSCLYSPSREVMNPDGFMLYRTIPSQLACIQQTDSFSISGKEVTAFDDIRIFDATGTLMYQLRKGESASLQSGVYVIQHKNTSDKIII